MTLGPLPGYAYWYPDGGLGVAPATIPVPEAPISGAQLQLIRDYLGDSIAGHTTADVGNAANAEREIQRRQCRGDLSNVALMEALCRRVARNLGMRNIPLGVQANDMGAIRPALEDAEVRRLERPFRRGVVG